MTKGRSPLQKTTQESNGKLLGVILPRTIMEVHQNESRMKSVNEISSYGDNLSLGRNNHELQVMSDRHPATVSNGAKIRVATWNVQTMFQKGKLENVLKEMSRMKIDILGLSEVRWTEAGTLRKNGYEVIYSGGDKHKNGVGIILNSQTASCMMGYWAVSDRVMLVKIKGNHFNINIIQAYAPTADAEIEKVEEFYESLDRAYKQCKSSEIKIVMGDINAKIGKGRELNIVGEFGIGERNERGELFVEWCIKNEQVVTNTWFKNHPRRIYTWTSPGDRARNQIDYITINERFRNSVKDSKTYPGADCGSDHNPVVATMCLKLRKNKKPVRKKRLQLNALENQEIKAKFKSEVVGKIDLNISANELWIETRKAIQEAAVNNIPIMTPVVEDKGWMNEEILNLMEKRRMVKGKNVVKYKEYNRVIRNKCNIAKEEWLDKQCQEIESTKNTKDFIMYDKVKKLAGKKRYNKAGCIKSENGQILTDTREICDRWVRYIKELFADKRGPMPEINSSEGLEITKDEIRNGIKNMKRGKAVGLDEISIEMLDALGEDGVKLLHKVFNEIYETGIFPEDFLTSVFITLPKKPGAVECEKHRTISIMCHSVKLLLSIIIERLRNKIRPEIAEEQYGFMPDKGTRNAFFVLRMLSERAIEHQNMLYLCFIDYTKAFDKVQHEKLLDMLQSLDIDGKSIQLVRNMYWNQKVSVRVQDQLTEQIEISRGVRQGCVMSPDLFNLYSEHILRNIKELEGIRVGGININNIRYADDTVLIATTEEDLQNLVDRVVEVSAGKGLMINNDKTRSMVISKTSEKPKKPKPKCHIKVGNINIKETESFNYLGSLVTADGKCKKEIRRRIMFSKDNFQKLKPIFSNRNISIQLKIRLLKCYIWPILTYGCEAWTITPELIRNLEAAEMWFLRRILGISYKDKITNVEVLKRTGVKRELISSITSRQLKFLGHVIRKEGTESVSLQGRIKGKRSRGRPRVKYLDRVKEIVKETMKVENCSIGQLHEYIRDKECWKSIIAKV